MRCISQFRITPASRSRVVRSTLPLLLCALSIVAPDVPAQSASPPAARPRVGLVLGGGGAKGAAHVGVLQALEQLHVPVDCVVGTSMGALVGGIYAAGNDAAQTTQLVEQIDWRETLAFAGLRDQLPMRRKQAGITYSNSLEFGVSHAGISAPAGIINSQHVEQVIHDLIGAIGVNADFDQLPIPFRSVATDMQSGEMVVFDRGDLSLAMRASMAVPGVFAPTIVDNRVLGDGGLVRNLPVDVARSACADVVIAVWLVTPTPKREALLSPLALISRSLDVVIDGNVRAQLDALTPQDVAIAVDLQDFGSADFDRIASTFAIGRAATLAHAADLQRFALPPDQYELWRAAHRADKSSPARIHDIRITGLKRVSDRYVRSSLEVKPGMVVDEKQIDAQVAAIYALDDFESVSYRLTGDPEHPDLAIHAVEKSWGPRFLRFDLGLAASSDGDTAFVLRSDYLQHWINRAGGEIHGALQIGRTSLLEGSLYQPLDAHHDWFVEPSLHVQRSLEDIYYDGEARARLDLRHGFGALDIGRAFGPAAEMRIGMRSGLARAQPDIASPQISGTRTDNEIGFTASAIYDTRNTPLLPTTGWLARLDYFDSRERFGSELDYRRLEGLLEAAFPFRHDVMIVAAAGGTSFGTNLPIYQSFTLGGPESFPGFRIGELRGNEYWTGSVSYLRKVADISALFGQALYLGIQTQAGWMEPIESLTGSDTYDHTLYSGSIFLTGRTPIGPATVSIGVSSERSWMLSFDLGRPVEEGTIMDFAR